MTHLIPFFPLFISAWYFALTLIGFGLLIFVHELGHFLVARRCNMRVEEFSIGFGRSLVSRDIDGVLWRLRLLPFGGFVRIAGMDDDPEKIPTPHSFYSRPLKERAQVILAGPLFNIATAFVLFCAVYALGGGSSALSQLNPIIGDLDVSSELYQKGLRPGDRILSYDDRPFSGTPDHLIAGSFAKKALRVRAEKIDYETGHAVEINAQITPSINHLSRRGSGIFSGAQALQIGALTPTITPDQFNLMVNDRLIWADGERLFSASQFLRLLNDERALITFQRESSVYSLRLEKLSLRQMRERGPVALCSDWFAWHSKSQNLSERELMCLPLHLRRDNVLLADGPVEKMKENAEFLQQPMSLRAGDRILAIDGCSVATPQQIAPLLLTKHIAMIVQRPSNLIQGDKKDLFTLSKALKSFETPFFSKELQILHQKVGNGPASIGPLTLLKPVEVSKGHSARYPDARTLGIMLCDASVSINPSPLVKLVRGIGEPLRMLGGLLTGTIGKKALSGPIGMAQVIYSSWSVSLNRVLDLLAIISLNLAVLNLLPLPVLDGGHLLFAFLEKVRGKPLKAQTMNRFITIFFALFTLAGLYIAYQDLFRLAGFAF